MDAPPELTELREQIAALDRELLDTLNRRLELVAHVQDHKHATGTRLIDSNQEAELLQGLAAANDGPLSERAVHSLFTAVLDVMKQELQGEPRLDTTAVERPAVPAGIATIAVIGTGLLGTSVALAARRAGVGTVQGWDVDGATLHEGFARAARNLPQVDVLPVQGINVYDILRHEKLVLTKAAIEALEARFK